MKIKKLEIQKSNISMSFLSVMFLQIIITAVSVIAMDSDYVIGDKKDVMPKLYGPVLNLGGGGYTAIQQMIDGARGCTDCEAELDVVVISGDGIESYRNHVVKNVSFISKLAGVDSVEVIFVPAMEGPTLDKGIESINKAELVFFDGGNQCNYIKHVRNSKFQRAVEGLYKRGGAVGVMSAGQAIQGNFVFDGCGLKDKPLTSEIALADPYSELISFSYDFFNWKFMQNTITDQHVVARKRLGRTLAFLARQIADKRTKRAFAIAVDEKVSVVVDAKGTANVIGTSDAYFVVADHKPEVCERGKPLTYSNFKVWKVSPGGRFNLKNRPQTGFYTVSVKEGKLDRDPY